MLESIVSIFQSFFAYSEYLVPAVWVALGCAVAWFLLSAKRIHEITPREAEILWKTHKQFKHCSAKKFDTIKKRKKTIGYICECGYKHKQERPMINIGS